MHKKEINDNVFAVYTPESCYWAGLLAADGHIDINGTIGLELKDEDSYLIEEFKEFCGSSHDISSNSIKHSRRIRFVSKKLQEDLLYNFSVSVDKTHNLQLPLLEYEHYKDYFRGFFDGDGCFSEFFNNRPMASFRVFLTNGSLYFLEETIHILRKFNVIQNGSIQQKAKNCWHIQLAISDSISFLNWIYLSKQTPFIKENTINIIILSY